MNDFYVYLFMRDNLCSPYYVGKGRGRRCFEKSGRRVPLPPERERIRKVAQDLTEEQAFELEKKLILFYGRTEKGGVLHNLTDGGEGINPERHSKVMLDYWEKVRAGLVPAPDRTWQRENASQRRPHPRTKPVSVRGVDYPSIGAAARALGVDRTTIRRWKD